MHIDIRYNRLHKACCTAEKQADANLNNQLMR